ncbi:uncharacterized protein [Asterias amurensis]|uniref:uncharacterized protein n=1 Tax=Asterias amurensis TaxID=7602 RepID=UPI003AB52171
MERYVCRGTIRMDLRRIFLSLVIVMYVNNEVSAQDCQFRNNLCDWQNEGDIDWVQKTVINGPDSAHYAEVVTDATPPGQHTAVLTSMTQNHVMTMLGFFYRLGAPNTLTVVARLDGGDVETLWSRNGTEDSESWIEVDLPVPKSSSFQISIKAVLPDNSTSFVGLTNITLRVGDDECAAMPCLNGGFCIDGNRSFTCVCSSGFKGELCQIDTNAPPRTTALPTPQTSSTRLSTILTTLLSTTHPTKFQKTTVIKMSPSVDTTVKYDTPTTPLSLPVKSDKQRKGMDEPVMIVIIAVAAIVGIAIFVTIVWMMAYVKKRSWRPNYHERGVSMENVNNTASVNGKWTSTVDLPGSIPESKHALTPVAEDAIPPKVESIYVVSPAGVNPIGIVNPGYNIEHMY